MTKVWCQRSFSIHLKGWTVSLFYCFQGTQITYLLLRCNLKSIHCNTTQQQIIWTQQVSTNNDEISNRSNWAGWWSNVSRDKLYGFSWLQPLPQGHFNYHSYINNSCAFDNVWLQIWFSALNNKICIHVVQSSNIRRYFLFLDLFTLEPSDAKVGKFAN